MVEKPKKEAGKTTKARGAGRKFQKGQSGNPGGRPKDGVSIASVAREYLEGTVVGVEGMEDVTRKVAFVIACYRHAMQGNHAFAKLIWDHVDGAPKQKIEGDVTGTFTLVDMMKRCEDG